MVRRVSHAPASAKSTVASILSRRRRSPVAGADPVRVEVRSVPAAQPRSKELDTVHYPESESTIGDLMDAVRNEARPHRGGDYLHVSDLIGKCIRKKALIAKYDLPLRPQNISFVEAVTFAQGNAIGEIVMKRLTRAAPGKLWGRWKCLCGHLTTPDPILFEEVDTGKLCEKCGGVAEHYVEVSMFDEELMIVGNPDVLLYLEQLDAFFVAELKSIAHAQFEQLERPKPEHVIQAVFYWFLMKRAGYRLTDRISIFYVTKGYVFRGKNYKEFSIDPQAELHRLDDYLDDAREYKKSRETGSLPARVTCASDSAPIASKCEVCSLCFAKDSNAPIEVNIDALFGDSARIHRRKR